MRAKVLSGSQGESITLVEMYVVPDNDLGVFPHPQVGYNPRLMIFP
ncbi:MAG: hypothetical protein VKL59_14700 [Nostocaceae cyanobacterium]|nr:hypothetical protein [Nostocaceae cyanobacterium]